MNDYEKNSEFSFGQLFALVKKSGIRILIFCVIAAVLMSIVTVSVYFGSSDRNNAVATVVNFNFKGIEVGLDPLGNEFNFRNIKSAHIVSMAITQLNDRGVNVNASMQPKIIDNIIIEGIVPENVLEQTIYYPSSYRVTLDNIKDLNLSTRVARQLLNQIIATYSEQFKIIYSGITLIPAEVITNPQNSVNYDFLELYDVFYTEILTAINYLSQTATAAPTFRYSQTGRSFNDIIRELQNIQTINLINFENFILSNGISNDSDALKDNISTKLKILEAQIARYKADALSIDEAIKSYKTDSEINIILYIDPKTGELVTASGGNTEQLDRMHQDLIETNKKVNALEEEKTVLEERESSFAEDSEGNTEENIAKATQTSKTIANLISAAIDEGNNAILEYYEQEYFKGAVTAPIGAVAVSENAVSLFMLLAISAIVVLIAAIAAVVTTYIIDKNKKLAKVGA